MVFTKDAIWKPDAVPVSAWWEHQLAAGPPSLRLDPLRWASHAMALHHINPDRP
jgi:hypothetical protein